MEELKPEIIITGHINADYDALAAMIAASKLYPGAVLIAPSMMDKAPQHEFSANLQQKFNLVSPRDCDLSSVKLLVVVDTHQTKRIEHVQEVLNNPGLEIHVYDHHPDTPEDLPATKKVLKFWGASTTILVHEIMDRNITLTEDEATMFGLGIYEDTNSFKFPSTTVHDFTAAAFLKSAGMDLSIILDHMNPEELNREQIYILNALISGAQTHIIQGIPVTITEISLDDFIGDVSSLVQRLIDMENLKVVFALAAMGSTIHMIARSKVPDINVAQICQSFGGGGHAPAASATIKDSPMAEVKNQLLSLLVSSVSENVLVARHMTSPAKTIYSDASLKYAEEMMNRFGLKAIPVIAPEDERCVGILDHQTAAKASTHQLGGLPVISYMHRNPKILPPDAHLYDAMEIILQQRQRLIPVVQHDKVVGVITRTDIIRLLIDETLQIPEGTPLTDSHRERNVSGVLKNNLPPDLVDLLKLAGKLGDELNISVFSVGGFVRDLILRQTNLDIDMSVEGDAIAYADKLAQRLGGQMRPYHKFKTATVFYKNKKGEDCHLDVATARLEYYESPGALPTVELSSIKMDLYRRDFTVNALAIQLNEARFGILIDPFGGQKDIKEKNIAVMHSLSFIEDPTRIMRAARFELRFNFTITAQTERLIENALSLHMIEKVSGVRLFNEFKHVCDEKEATACIRRLNNWGLLRMVDPVLELNPTKDIIISNIDEIMNWYGLSYDSSQPRNWIVYLLALCANAKYPDVSAMLVRFGFIDKYRQKFLKLRETVRNAVSALGKLRKRDVPPKTSEIYDLLHGIAVEGLLYIMAFHGQEDESCKLVSHYITNVKDIKLDITGDDLVAMGETPGPHFPEILNATLAAKIDKEIVSRDEQFSFAMEYAKRKHGFTEYAEEVLAGRT